MRTLKSLSFTGATAAASVAALMASSMAQSPPVTEETVAERGAEMKSLSPQSKALSPEDKAAAAESGEAAPPVFLLGNGHTSVTPHPKAAGGALKMQQEVAELLSGLDPRPQQRLAHFRRFVGENLVCVGWQGTIIDMTPNAPGWLVVIRVTPQLASRQGLVILSDCVDETYQYSNGELRYMGGVVPRDVPSGGINTF